MKLPEHIAARIAETIASLPPERSYHIDWEAKQHGAIALMGTIGSTWLLRPDGSLLDVDSDFGKPLQPLPEDLHVTAIVAGCERYPWLRELLPARPDDAIDCPQCLGRGQLHASGAEDQHGVFCPACQALGWIQCADLAKPNRELSFGGSASSSPYPTFVEAQARFAAFLLAHAWPTRIAWITLSSVRYAGGTVLAPCELTSVHAQALYEDGVRRDLGVQLSALWKTTDAALCIIVVPDDALDAEHRMMSSGLKLSLAASPQPARFVGFWGGLWARVVGRAIDHHW
jgi:hypothetical protein